MTARERQWHDGAAEEAASQSALGFERIVFFSDAVFAIVITLLILPLATETAQPEETTDVAAHVLNMWPKMLTFLIGFLVVGQFWIAHHRLFAQLQRSDRGLMWLNLFALLTVCFMPFPTALLGAYSTADDHFPVVFYAASMTLTSVILTVTWIYAVRRRLVQTAISGRQRRDFTLRALVTSAVFLVSIGAAFLGLYVASVFWLVLLPAARVFVVRLGSR